MDSSDRLLQVEYFDFEKDFMEDNVRCIPMIVRFKLDTIGIKLKLKEWSKMNAEERDSLANLPVITASDLHSSRNYLEQVIAKRTGEKPTLLTLDQQNLSWRETSQLPQTVIDKLNELNKEITLEQWKSLGALKRYALLKLSRPGHENRNFPKALKEFGLNN